MRAYFEKALNLKVEHDKVEKKFLVSLANDELSVNYEAEGKKIWKITSVNIPQEVRNMGIANRVVEYVLEYARKRGIGIKPACDFIKIYIVKNPYYRAIVAS